MKTSILLCALSLFSTVFCSAGAGALQVVYEWYAYQLEIQAAPATRIIAPGCVGAGGGNCNFDEFVRYIQLPTKPKGSSKNAKAVLWAAGASTGIGDELNPDPIVAADALSAEGYASVNDVKKLIPSSEGGDMKAIFEPIGKSVASSRATLAAKGVDISPMLDHMQKAMKGIIVARQVEQSSGILRDFQTWCTQTKCSFTIETKTVTADDGVTTYETLDTDKILANNADNISGVKDDIKKWVPLYTTGTLAPVNPAKPLMAGFRHMKVILMFQEMYSDLTQNISC
ncbi:hypothetical protein ACMFMG_010437 [Clarireedia jacksonii]